MQSDLNFLHQNVKDYLWRTSNLSDSLNQPLLLAYCSLIFVKEGLVTLPHLNKDLPTGTVKSILKQAGIE